MTTDKPEPKSDRPSKPLAAKASLLNNWISLAGFGLMAIAIMLLLTFALFGAVAGKENPYADVAAYLILPGVLIMGMSVVPLGMLVTYVRRRRRGQIKLLPAIDLNDRRTRRGVLIFIIVSILLVLPALTASSYGMYHYTESSEFCGQVCHVAMHPQAVAHGSSPHARVTCAECHIGAGAGWFVKAKLSGTRQVLAVWQDSFPRPIPSAITELRPARETCEECHWPEKFFGEQYREFVRFSEDEANTRRFVKMLLLTGGSDDAVGRVEGIHSHMALSAEVEYVAEDELLQDIPWIRYTDHDGNTRVFRSDEQPADAPPPEGVVRRVDCMDCHNRGAHHFRSPQVAVDRYMEVDRIDRTLPFIKVQAVQALAQPFDDRDSAETEIGRRIRSFYEERQPDVWRSRQDDIEEAIVSVIDIYSRNFFPDMNVNWRTYPENIGHMYSPGCFRCHDGRHVDADGEAISSQCNGICHTFVFIQGEETDPMVGPFLAADSIDQVLHGNVPCRECHTGGMMPVCRDCHDDIVPGFNMRMHDFSGEESLDEATENAPPPTDGGVAAAPDAGVR